MNSKAILSLNIKKFLFLILILGIVQQLYTQELELLVSDSAKAANTYYDLSEITTRSTETVSKAKEISASLVNNSQIDSYETIYDSVLKEVDSILLNRQELGFEDAPLRTLSNEKVYWKNWEEYLDKEKNKFIDLTEYFEEKKKEIEDEQSVWNRTLDYWEAKNQKEVVNVTISEVLENLNITFDSIVYKEERLIILIDQLSAAQIRIQDLDYILDELIAFQKRNLFERNQKSIFSKTVYDREVLNIIEPIKVFYFTEIKSLKDYFALHLMNLIGWVALFILLYELFRRIKKKTSENNTNNSTTTEVAFQKIISNSFFASVLVSLAATTLIFPNRSEVFIDLTLILAVIPLVKISKTIAPSSFNTILHTIAAAVILQFLLSIYSAEYLINRLTLIAINIIFMVVSFRLYTYYKNTRLKNGLLNNLLLLLVSIHFIASVMGLLAAVFGAVRLSEYVINAIIANIISFLLLFIIVLIIRSIVRYSFYQTRMSNLNIVKIRGGSFLRKFEILIIIGAIVIWMNVIFKYLNINSYFSDLIGSVFNFQMTIGAVSFSLKGITIFILIIWLSIVVSNFLNILLEKDILNRFSLAKGIPHTVSLLVKYTLITFGFILAVSAAGFPLKNFTILFGAFGVGIGFGLQNIFNNLVSGLILLFERPIQIGDTVEVEELIGTVRSIGIRSSNIRTFEGAEVVVPNGALVSNKVINWTLSDQTRRIEVMAGVAYGTDPHLVKDLLLKKLDEHPEIIKNPEPMVLFNNMGESSLDFRLLFWTSKIGEWLRIQSEVTFLVHDCLKEAGIEIPFPQRDIHVKTFNADIVAKKDN